VGTDDDWSGNYGGNPNTNKHYPICTLTWDIALNSYMTAGFGAGSSNFATSVQNYLTYVITPTGGQTDYAEQDYLALEEPQKKFAKEEVAFIQ
jgi:hypothetical protein